MRALFLTLALALAACGSDAPDVTVEGVDPSGGGDQLAPDATVQPGGALAPDADLAPEPELAPEATLEPDA